MINVKPFKLSWYLLFWNSSTTKTRVCKIIAMNIHIKPSYHARINETILFFIFKTLCFFLMYLTKITLTQFLGKLGFFLGIDHHKAYIFMFQDLGHKLKGKTRRIREPKAERCRLCHRIIFWDVQGAFLHTPIITVTNWGKRTLRLSPQEDGYPPTSGMA